MRVLAPAKLNLFLHVIGRQSNGFHLLQSALCFTSLADELCIEPSDSSSLTVNGDFAPLVSSEDNLVLKAARKLSVSHGAHITLTKNIPVGAGLGGGSADAAAALVALNQFWDLKRTNAELIAIAETLGSDVPACLSTTPKRMEGTGHVLSPISLPSLHGVLLYPRKALSTQAVYAGVQTFSASVSSFELEAICGYKNDLETPAIALMPEIAEMLRALSTTGCTTARMSGSGSCCFAIYETEENARTAEAALAVQYPHYFVRKFVTYAPQ